MTLGAEEGKVPDRLVMDVDWHDISWAKGDGVQVGVDRKGRLAVLHRTVRMRHRLGHRGGHLVQTRRGRKSGKLEMTQARSGWATRGAGGGGGGGLSQSSARMSLRPGFRRRIASKVTGWIGCTHMYTYYYLCSDKT